MNKSLPPTLLRRIIAKSTQDTVESAPSFRSEQSFIPQELYEVLEHGGRPYAGMVGAAEHYYKVLSGLTKFNDLTPDIYWYVWKLLLYLEHYQCIWDMRKYYLPTQMIAQSKFRMDEFVVRVPGLSEDRPSLRARDEVELLQVDGINFCKSTVTYVGKDYVAVRVPAEFRNRFQENQKYNIEFRYFDWAMNCLNYVLNSIDKYKLSPMLFPVSEYHYDIQNDDAINWINKNIENNPEQQQAIKNILKKTARPAPYILFGPPGTGKTSTLVEAICQIMIKNPSTKVLICTPSNAAADEIALRLLKNSIQEMSLYRMYSASRNSNDVNENIKPFSNFVDSQSVYISREVFVTKKIVITTLATCIRLYNYKLRENHFSYLFVDEAGQATELETLVPFVLMSGKDSDNVSKFYGQIVIAGDPKQLGPVIQSKLAEPLLGKSMLERLMKWGPYKKNERNKYDPFYVTKLVQNYRCHKTILRVPNILFYEGELVAKGGKHTTKAMTWSGLPKKNFPIIFHAVKGKEAREPHSPSVYNDDEVSAVVNYVKKLLNSKLDGKVVRQEEIGVITPYKLQRMKIHRALERGNMKNISVGTVEIFQGQERDIIIISTVRSVLYMAGQRIHIGFLSNPKRFNVAITRAKSLLIVVGNPEILQHDEYWREFVQYCVDNKACTGAKFELRQFVSMAKIRKLMGKKHVPTPDWETKPQGPVVEDPVSLPTTEGSAKEDNRRRRVPIGPLPKDLQHLVNTSESSLDDLEIDYNEQYLTMEKDLSEDEDGEDLYYHYYDELSDDYDSSYVFSDEMDDQESDDSFGGASPDLDDDEDSVLDQLRDRMQNLNINKSS